MSKATETDYMKSVRYSARLLAEEITPDLAERGVIADRLVTFASTVLDAARFEAQRDSA